MGGDKSSNHVSLVATDEDEDSYPGSRSGSTSWFDGQERLWLFGGEGFDNKSTFQASFLNDLWRYDSSISTWKLMPTKKTKPSDSHIPMPKARRFAVSCGVENVIFVIYGGLDADGKTLNDTWIYDISNSTWVPLHFKHNPVSPSARSEAAYWCLKDRLVIFGGLDQQLKVKSDTWVFSLKTLSWSELVTSGPGSGGRTTLARNGATTWLTDTGEMYLFGGNTMNGVEHSAHIGVGYTSDIWYLTLKPPEWKQVSGPTEPQCQAAIFGDLASPSKNNTPGCRKGAAGWLDTDGNLWVFGGSGTGSRVLDSDNKMALLLSDLWMFDLGKEVWTWMGGLSEVEGKPEYGKEDVASIYNIPGARTGATYWTANNRFYMFGGEGHDVDGHDGFLNDLWRLKLKHNAVTDDSDSAFMRTFRKLSPGIIFLACVCSFGGIAILFAVIMYARKCFNQPRHGPAGGYNVRYSPLTEDANLEMES